MRYHAIQQMMIQGRFQLASDHLKTILRRNPDDPDALRLDGICRQMLEMIRTFEANDILSQDISVSEYVSTHVRKWLKFLCAWTLVFLDKMPKSWAERLGKSHFSRLTCAFAEADDSGKDWMWELLFWDNRRRRVLFISLGSLVVIGISLLIWIGFSGTQSAPELAERQTTGVIQKANAGDLEAQYQLGLCFYRGIEVPIDIEQSYFWLSRAARGGHGKAADFLPRIIFEMENKRRVKDPEETVPSTQKNFLPSIHW